MKKSLCFKSYFFEEVVWMVQLKEYSLRTSLQDLLFMYDLSVVLLSDR